MDSNKILCSTYEEILFDGKNKAYGAYLLRINYERRMRQALLILMLFLASLVGMSMLPFVAKDTNDKVDPLGRGTTHLSEVHIIRNRPHEASTSSKRQHKESIRNIGNKITQRMGFKIVNNDHLNQVDSVVVDISYSKIGTSGDSSGTLASGSGGETGVQDITKEGIKDDFSKHTLGEWAEVMPSFNGDLNKYLEKYLRYPEAAKEAGIEGRVVVQFVVNIDGSISDALILKSLGAGCEEEALRVINSMPKWKPGKQNGTAIRVLYKQPITFMLQ